MKRACRILFASGISLYAPLILESALAQQVQVTTSFPVCKANDDTLRLPTINPVSPSADVLKSDTGHNPNDRIDATPQSTSDSGDSEIYYFYEPYPMEPGASFWQIGASISLVPLAEAEQEYPMPGLDVQYKRGLFKNVSYVGSYSTSWYSHLLHTGLQWNTKFDRFSFGIANHFGIAFGFMNNVDVFEKVVAYGLFYMPMLRFGYRFDDFSLSCSLVMTYVFKADSRVNKSTAYVGPQRTANDFYFTWAVEQPFLRHLHLSVGMSLGYARTPYQSWMQYNTTDEWLFVPEFFFAVQL
jgi:hypothetical protein